MMKDLRSIRQFVSVALMLAAMLSSCKDFDDREHIPFRFDFESEAELDRFVWRCREVFERTEAFATSGDFGLRLEISSGADPGLKPVLFQTDWSKFRFFHFDVLNPAADTVRVKLRLAKNRETPYPDRVEQPVEIPPGRHHLAIALDSLVYISGAGAFSRNHVEHCKIYLPGATRKTVLYFDNLYLE